MNIPDITNQGNRFTLSHSLKSNNAIFCIFEEQNLYSYNKEKKHFLSLDINTEEIKWLAFPGELNDAIYFDFFEMENKLILLDYHGDTHYSYDKLRNKWTKTEDVGDVVYEDSEYSIAYQDHGEWGEYTSFMNKSTEQEYVLAEDGKLVNKLGNKYILTSGGRIIEISYPDSLVKCTDNCYFSENSVNKVLQPELDNEDAVNFLYNDSIYSDWDLDKRKTHIISSWIINNELFHLYNTEHTTAIGQLHEEKLISKVLLPKKYAVTKPHHSYRGVNTDNDKRFHFYMENENTCGFIIIDNKNIDIVSFYYNQDSLEYLGSSMFDYWENAELLFTGDINYSYIRRYEKENKGVNLNEHRSGKIFRGWHPQKLVDKKSNYDRFIRVENEFIAQITEYHYDSKSDEIKSILIEWTETNPYKIQRGFKNILNTNSYIVENFQEKHIFVRKFISDKLGVEPKVDDSSNFYMRYIWEINNEHEITLSFPKKIDRNPKIILLIH